MKSEIFSLPEHPMFVKVVLVGTIGSLMSVYHHVAELDEEFAEIQLLSNKLLVSCAAVEP